MLNLIVLTGHLGADPEIFYTSEGKPVASFSLAFHCGKDKTGWIKVACFQKLAEICEKHLHKGAKIALAGSLEHEKWENQNHETKTSFKIIAHTIEFIKTDGRGFKEGEANKEGESNNEDLPF